MSDLATKIVMEHIKEEVEGIIKEFQDKTVGDLRKSLNNCVGNTYSFKGHRVTIKSVGEDKVSVEILLSPVEFKNSEV